MQTIIEGHVTTIAHCGGFYTCTPVHIKGQGRDVRITCNGHDVTVCEVCGVNLKTLWWQDQMSKWAQSMSKEKPIMTAMVNMEVSERMPMVSNAVRQALDERGKLAVKEA